MSDLSTMKARIADELARDDLTSQIAYAISDAIKAYDHIRFRWCETRGLTATTVADQEYYTSSDFGTNFNKLIGIDHVTATIGTWSYQLRKLTPQQAESASNSGLNTGQPGHYSFYSDQLRLYPVPNQAWTLRISGPIRVDAPATDLEADNPWMTHAERLIRSRAKLELALHVIYDQAMADTLALATSEALDQLRDESVSIMFEEAGDVRPWGI